MGVENTCAMTDCIVGGLGKEMSKNKFTFLFGHKENRLLSSVLAAVFVASETLQALKGPLVQRNTFSLPSQFSYRIFSSLIIHIISSIIGEITLQPES